MKDLDKLKSIIKYHDSEKLLVELYTLLEDNEKAQMWLDNVYNGYPEQEDEGYDYLDDYARNSNWRSM